MGLLESIKQKLLQKGYSNEYEFAVDIATMFSLAHDNHFVYTPDILAVIRFFRPAQTTLVSISNDGESLPELYTLSDVKAIQSGQQFNASAVVLINGQEANQYIEDASELIAQSQDPDAAFNSLLVNQAQSSLGQGGAGSFFASQFFPGPSTEFGFKNNTKRVFVNRASIAGNFSGVTDGQSFFKKFCTGAALAALEAEAATPAPSSTTAPSNSSVPVSTPLSTSTPTPTAAGYPYPVIKHSRNAVGGYFLNGSGFSDVAILSIPSFSVPTLDGQEEFQTVIRTFLKEATASKKTKLIVDIRGNPGGNFVLGYDAFRQLFPSLVPYGGTRYRSTPFFRETTTIYSQFFSDVSPTNVTEEDISSGYGSSFNFRNDLNEAGEDFKSVADFVGPHTFHDDTFTSVTRLNIRDQHATYQFNISGSGDAPLPSSQPFEAKNIIMLHDGVCASTCALFSEMMKSQGQVKSIAVGGRPRNGPMQGVGQTKGGEVWSFLNIVRLVTSSLEMADAMPEQNLPTNEVTKLANLTAPLKRAAYQPDGSILAQINVRNNYRKDDSLQIPLQFVYEPADCRIWNTLPMVLDPTEVWKVAASSMWGNGTCIQGSTDVKGSVTSGNITVDARFVE